MSVFEKETNWQKSGRSALFGIVASLCLWACQDNTPHSAPISSQQDTAKKVNLIKSQAMATKGTGAPALWKLSDQDTVIFLFGTIHNLKEGSAWRTGVFDQAFEQAEILVLEADLTSKTARRKLDDYQWQNGQLPAGQNLFAMMSPGDAYKLRTAIKHYGHNPESVQFLQPWLAALRISQMRFQHIEFSAGLGVDFILEENAKTSGKALHYLENLEDQMAIFRHASPKDQVERLIALSGDVGDLQADMHLISDEWLDGDIEGLGLLVANPGLFRSPESYDALLKTRNEKWAAQIDDLFAGNATVLIAVGAAHLAGPDNLIKMVNTEDRTLERLQ